MKDFSAERLRVWTELSNETDLTYHRERKLLWDKFLDCRTTEESEANIQIDKGLIRSIKGCLCCRNTELSDDKRLAFETAVEQIEDLL